MDAQIVFAIAVIGIFTKYLVINFAKKSQKNYFNTNKFYQHSFHFNKSEPKNVESNGNTKVWNL